MLLGGTVSYEEGHVPQYGPATLPLVAGIGVSPEVGKLLISLTGSPFGASITPPHIFMMRGDRGQDKYVLHGRIDQLLVLMLASRRVENIIVTGAEGGNEIILKLSVPATDAPEFALYNLMVEMTAWLYDLIGNSEEVSSVGIRLATLTSMENPDRLRFNEAIDKTYTNIRIGLCNAINAALLAKKLMP